MRENNLTEGNILKKLLLFAVPFLIANVLQSLGSLTVSYFKKPLQAL